VLEEVELVLALVAAATYIVELKVDIIIPR
jgi:hypothetical protein